MGDGELRCELKDGIGTITISRPARGNTLTVGLLMELIRTLHHWSEADACRVVVVRGVGQKSFCYGFDVAELPTRADHENTPVFLTEDPVEGALDVLKAYPYPTIAMLNGDAMGIGFALAMCCDLRVAAEHVRMGARPAKLGLVYPPGTLKQLAEAIGMARAREVLFTARTYGPAEVRELGFVHRMVPAAELEKAVYELAREIAENAPLSLTGMKRILGMIGLSAPLSDSDRMEAYRLVALSFLSQDAREGQAAFLQKRKPEFKGK
jgi:enoyl-CoA hydratase